MENSKKTLEYYKRLPYTLYKEPIGDPDGTKYWTAEYTELRGCKTEGATESEAVANLQELFDEYITAKIEENINIPEPTRRAVSVGEVWIVAPKDLSLPVSSPDEIGEDTRETKSEIISKTMSVNYEEIAA